MQNSGSTTWQDLDFPQTNLHMLDNESLTDVTILAGEDRTAIKAHTIILASRSPVFFTMFCGSLPESSEVVIPDIDPQTMTTLIRYKFTNRFDYYLVCKFKLKNIKHLIIEYRFVYIILTI